MQMFLCPDLEVSPSITLTDNGSCFETIWEDGAKIETKEHDLTRLEFSCENLPAGKFPDFAISDLGCPVVSERLKTALLAQGVDNIDYYPATIIEHKDQSPAGGYYAANILGLVDCIDTDKSEFEGIVIDGEVKGIQMFDKLILKNQSINFGKIYRVRFFRCWLALCSIPQKMILAVRV